MKKRYLFVFIICVMLEYGIIRLAFWQGFRNEITTGDIARSLIESIPASIILIVVAVLSFIKLKDSIDNKKIQSLRLIKNTNSKDKTGE
ncbi:MAG: hypothetical protein J6O40_02840 [Ruminococcus sp.]|nr:hypothetical protein [Ruminococcus sp.]